MLLLSLSIGYSGGWSGVLWQAEAKLTWVYVTLNSLSALSGLELTFYSGVYGTCIGAMTQFGQDAKSLIGISGICIGIGEILGESSVLWASSPYLWCRLSHDNAAERTRKPPESETDLFSLLCLARRGRVWDAEQVQPVWEEPRGAAGTHHSLCRLLPDFPQHRQRRSHSPGSGNGSAGLHQPQVQRPQRGSQKQKTERICSHLRGVS